MALFLVGINLEPWDKVIQRASGKIARSVSRPVCALISERMG